MFLRQKVQRCTRIAESTKKSLELHCVSQCILPTGSLQKQEPWDFPRFPRFSHSLELHEYTSVFRYSVSGFLRTHHRFLDWFLENPPSYARASFPRKMLYPPRKPHIWKLLVANLFFFKTAPHNSGLARLNDQKNAKMMKISAFWDTRPWTASYFSATGKIPT